MDISSLFSRFFPAHGPIPPGNYRGNLYTQSSLPNKAHLRVEKDGNGILILNGSLVLHLNQTATELAYYLIQNIPLEKISKNIRKSIWGFPRTICRRYSEIHQPNRHSPEHTRP